MEHFRHITCKCLGSMLFGTCLVLFSLFPFQKAEGAGGDGGKKFVMEFVFTATDGEGETIYEESGSVAVNGGMYRLEVQEDLMVIGNGETQWLYKPQSEEIIIVSSEISNKLATAGNIDELAMELVSLFVSGAGADGGKPQIIKGRNGRLSEIRINAGKACYKIKITSFSEVDSLPYSLFVFDSSQYPNAVITDLRQ